MKRALVSFLFLLSITGALMWWLLRSQQADPAYVPRISSRTWAASGPVVVIDDGHWNGYTAGRGYGPLVKLLTTDGYIVLEHGNAGSSDVLEGATVVVISNAMGLRGLIRQAGQLAGLQLNALAADAFSDEEADRIEAWVREGGNLLLVADPAPAGRSMQSVAQRFEVTMRDNTVFDPDHAGEPDAATFIVFTRETRTMASHPILNGRTAGDRVNRVVVFTGQALEGPPHATRLLVYAQSAFEMPAGTSTEDAPSAGGMAQALAFTHGRGRVVVLGDGAVLTSQLMTSEGETRRIGLAWPDNEKFTRNIMRWLSRAGE